MQRKKIIIFAVMLLTLVLFGTVSSFAVLPEYPDSSASTFVPEMLTRDDTVKLLEGLYAQEQLLSPAVRNPRLFYLTLVRDSETSFHYHLFVDAPSSAAPFEGTFSFVGPDGVADVYDYGMWVKTSATFSGSVRQISLLQTGGALLATRNVLYKYEQTISGYGIKLADNEVVVAYWDYSDSTVKALAPAQFYSASYLPEHSVQMTAVRQMAQSWIDARDVKANGYPPPPDGDYQTGYNKGYEEGYLKGHDDGETAGYNQGKIDGLSEGYLSGKKAGYKQAQEELGSDAAVIDIAQIITAVPTGVRQFIISTFGFELFGINIAGLLSVVILVVLTVFAIKQFRGF